MGFDDAVDFGHEADGFVQRDDDALVVVNVNSGGTIDSFVCDQENNASLASCNY
ncbi:MAG: hypothetical protein Q8J90_00840 [Gallionella sp.]|nr:hypothetical protein [Gallionella sp.]